MFLIGLLDFTIHLHNLCHICTEPSLRPVSVVLHVACSHRQRDKTRQFCRVSNCVHTVDADKTKLPSKLGRDETKLSYRRLGGVNKPWRTHWLRLMRREALLWPVSVAQWANTLSQPHYLSCWLTCDDLGSVHEYWRSFMLVSVFSDPEVLLCCYSCWSKTILGLHPIDLVEVESGDYSARGMRMSCCCRQWTDRCFGNSQHWRFLANTTIRNNQLTTKLTGRHTFVQCWCRIQSK